MSAITYYFFGMMGPYCLKLITPIPLPLWTKFGSLSNSKQPKI